MIRLLLCLILLSPAAAQAQSPSDPLRGLIWGLPKSEVEKFETARPAGGEDAMIFYRDKIRIDDTRVYWALIEYHFTDNKLDRIRYDFDLPQTNPGETMNDAMAMQTWMDNALGQAGAPRFTFRRQTDRNDSGRWGWAIYKGNATMRIDWSAPRAGALLMLTGKNFTADMKLTLSRPQKTPQTP